MHLLKKLGRLEDILELRKLRRARQGIDVTKLNKGDVKKKKKKVVEGGISSPNVSMSKAREGDDDESVFQIFKVRTGGC